MSKRYNNKKFYPYARIKAMHEIMEFIRDPDWNPKVINRELLELLGIAPSKEREVINALKFLGIIDDEMRPTQVLGALKTDYSHGMINIVNDVYADLFSILPTKLIDQDRVVNFFMNSSGTSRDTAEYQGMFFKWACNEAGIELPNLPESFKRARFRKKQN